MEESSSSEEEEEEAVITEEERQEMEMMERYDKFLCMALHFFDVLPYFYFHTYVIIFRVVSRLIQHSWFY